jgi:phosphatidylinositol-3-phosphatase
MITNSPAFKEDGLLIVTFDEGGLAFDGANSRITAQGVSRCAQQPGANIGPLVTGDQPLTLQFESASPPFFEVTQGFGGHRIGAVLLSKILKPGTVSNIPFNYYSMLKTIQHGP